MLLAWMLYATAVGMLVAGAAVALDRLAAIWSVPRRVIWFGAAAAALALPVALIAWRAPAPAPVPTDEWMEFKLPPNAIRATRRQTTVVAPAITLKLANATPPGWRLPPAWDAPAGTFWIVGSLMLLAIGARGLWMTAHRRSAWAESIVDGYPVLVAPDSGPAVVGAFDPNIVLPRWALELSRTERELMLRHEAEHIAARDPLLLAIAGIMLLLFPWNAPLWFIVRQLRLAVEIDCDARVLRTISRPREYGMLLISVSARHGTALPLAASLVERRLLIERRIVAMTTSRPARPLIASLPFAAIVGLAAAAVAQTPKPAAQAGEPAKVAATKAPTAPAAKPRPAAKPPKLVTPKAEKPEAAAIVEVKPQPRTEACCSISDDTLAVWMARYHADVVNGVLNAENVVFVVDADGRYVTSRVQARSASDIERMKAEREAVTARVATEKLNVLRAPGEKIALTEVAAAADRELAARKMAETRVALPLTVEDAERLKAKAAMEKLANDDELFAKLKETASKVEGVARELRLQQNDALTGLNIPAEAIQAVQVQKLAEGRMAPGRIGIITVFLKRD